jgi:hypothetical protein
MLAISSWNIDPNREWYVSLSDVGTGLMVQLYLSQSDAQAGTNIQASGYSSGYGTGLPVTMANRPGATYPVSLFQSTYAWHLKVSGSAGDAEKIVRLKAFVELDEISHALFRNADLIAIRATAEIDAHTHAKIPREIQLGSHVPTLEPGDVVSMDSSRRSKNEMGQVSECRIIGELSDGGETKLTNTAIIPIYQALKR